MMEELKELICQFVEADSDEITENSRFAEDLGFNSYDLMCMLGEAEDVFDVEFSESDAASCKTAGDLLRYIEGLK